LRVTAQRSAVGRPASCDNQRDVDNKRQQSSLGAIRHHLKGVQKVAAFLPVNMRYDVSENVDC
jgi:hypothetical protein